MAEETKVVFERPHALLPVVTNYCPGCTHGIVNRLVAEVMDELDIEGKTVGIAGFGAIVQATGFFQERSQHGTGGIRFKQLHGILFQ